MLNFILEQPEKRLNERSTKFISYQVIAAVSFLNKFDVVHCDVKPENVLLVKKEPFPQIKLCDFGYSRILNKGSIRRGSFVGTMNYLPPEALCPSPNFSSSLDTWACGVVIYVSLSGVFPYNPQGDIRGQIADDRIFFSSNNWSHVSPLAKECIRKMMELQSRKRVDCSRIKRHPWFSTDYILWSDLKAFEQRFTALTGDSRSWWSDDLNINNCMEELRTARNLPHWSQIGCIVQPNLAPNNDNNNNNNNNNGTMEEHF